jgi:hypothetical protein
MKYIKLYENFGDIVYDAILIGGLDYRSGDFPIDKQVEMLKKTYGANKKVKGFRYKESTKKILDFLKENPKRGIDIYMFSAGCSKAEELTKSPEVDPKRIFIIEPYASSTRTKKIVENAVKAGVPAQNVYVGPSVPRGKGIVVGASNSNSSDHWGALKAYKKK